MVIFHCYVSSPEGKPWVKTVARKTIPYVSSVFCWVLDWFRGKNCRKSPYFMGNTMVSCRFSLPILILGRRAPGQHRASIISKTSSSVQERSPKFLPAGYYGYINITIYIWVNYNISLIVYDISNIHMVCYIYTYNHIWIRIWWI